MPGGDRTGPMGQGPMTGRGMGYCSGNVQPGYAVSGFGCGLGRRGRGRGFRNMYYMTGQPGWRRYTAPAVPVDSQKALQNQARYLEEELNQIKEELARYEEDKS